MATIPNVFRKVWVSLYRAVDSLRTNEHDQKRAIAFLVADATPAGQVGLQVQLLGRSNAAIERDPAHDLGIDEMTWTRARFSRFSTLMTPSSSQQVRL